eukprot:TRINITY_DN13732_c0_g1_i1.p1 TRINITY_DN13732_c0_g1~~TRINITY_DN13732_c0_g1_i1.p1  ORF type:complete len:140 (+),score=12.28 TRINITY_DN13732_c0_g1_i1:162-581(+)
MKSKPTANYIGVKSNHKESFQKPMVVARQAPTEDLACAWAEPTGDFGRCGRSSYHYNPHKPLGRRADQRLASCKFDGVLMPHVPAAMARYTLASPRSSRANTAPAGATRAPPEKGVFRVGATVTRPAFGYMMHYHPRIF